MAKRFKCPECGKEGDIRGANSHMRQIHGVEDATAEDVEVIEDPAEDPAENGNEERGQNEDEAAGDSENTALVGALLGVVLYYLWVRR